MEVGQITDGVSCLGCNFRSQSKQLNGKQLGTHVEQCSGTVIFAVLKHAATTTASGVLKQA